VGGMGSKAFRAHEIDYMKASDLGRLATMAPDGTLQNSPVGFSYNAELGTIDIAGYRMSSSRKFRNIATNPVVAFVVDDIASRDPWRVRCLEIRGTAEQAELDSAPTESNGDALDRSIIRITPRRIIGFGIDDTDTEPHLLTADARNV
jgi:pyridoxamine 5'-phosphate oxidase family protein